MEKSIPGYFKDITGLVRSIQRAEGNADCFRRNGENCDRLDCFWRKCCLKKTDTFSINKHQKSKLSKKLDDLRGTVIA